MKITNKIQELTDMFSINKALMYLCILLLIYASLVTATLTRFISSYEIRPFFIKAYDKSEQVYRIEPLEKNIKAMELGKERFALEYVMKREAIDLQIDSERWSTLALMHSDELNRQFFSLMREDNKDSPLREFRQRGIQRKVQIITTSSLAPIAVDTYQVEWVGKDISVRMEDREDLHLNGKVNLARVQRFVSTITVEIEQNPKVAHDDRLINPFNIKVINYRVDKKAKVKV